MLVTKIKMTMLAFTIAGVLAVGGILAHSLTAAPQPEGRGEDAAPKKEAEPKPISVRVVKPRPGGLERIAYSTGTLIASQEQRLGPLVSGTVNEVTVDIGDRVKKGQVLIVFDAPLLAQEVEQATAKLEMAQAQMEEAKAQVNIADTEMESAVRDLKRYTASAEAVGVGKLAAAQTDVKVKQGKVLLAKASLQVAKAKVKARRAAVDKARIQESFTRLTAAFDGVITRRTIDPGNFFQPSDSRLLTPLLTLQRLDPLRVVAQIHGWSAQIIERGDTVVVDVDTVPHVRLPNQKIARLSRVIDSSPHELDPTRQAMTVEIDVPNPDMRLLPGMRALATVHLKKRFANALVVPASCVGERGLGYRRLFVVRGGKAHETPVEVTYDDGENVEISKGIKASDLIAVDKVSLKDGMPVKVERAP